MTKLAFTKKLTDDQHYGLTTLFKDDVLAEELSEEEDFGNILKRCRFYKGVIYDQKKTDGWTYPEWKDTSPRFAPKSLHIKPFKWEVEQGDGDVTITLDDEGFDSAAKDIVVGTELIRDETSTLIRTKDEIKELVQDIRLVGVDRVINGGYDRILNFEAIGILNILSNFLDINVFNGTRSVFINGLKVVQSDENGCSPSNPCEGVVCEEGYVCDYKGDCVEQTCLPPEIGTGTVIVEPSYML